MKNRIGICALYDKQGIVDESVIYLLHEMKNVLTHLVVVCNGFVEEKGIKKLTVYADELYMRDNSGYDVAAYKYILNECIGWDRLREYDELVLFNTTFFGPFCPVERIFDEMGRRQKDFWGITRHGAMRIDKYQVIPHVQSYFLVVSKQLLYSEEFKEFWLSRQDRLEDVTFVINDFELAFTKIFEDKGYKWDTYVDTRELEGEDIENNFNPLVYLPCLLLSKYKLPILKKRLWPWTQIEKTSGNELKDALVYVEKNTNYNVDIIWRYMIRCLDVNELRKALHLHFILPNQVQLNKNPRQQKERPAVIVGVHEQEEISCFENHNSWLFGNCDVYFVLPDKTGSIGGAIFSVVTEIIDRYHYICLLHWLSVFGNKTPMQMSVNKTWWDNLLGNNIYVDNILGTFADNPLLGVLCPPVPYHANYLKEKSGEWYYEYEEIEKLTQVLHLCCNISEKAESMVTDFTFWFRTEALDVLMVAKNFLNRYFQESPMADAIFPRVVPYVAQHKGYYTAIVEEEDFAGMHLEGIYHLLEQSYLNETRNEKKKSLLKFCRIHKPLYIYGAGKFGMEAEHCLNQYGINFTGFVVSDEHWEENQEKILSHAIHPLSQIEDVSNVGILVALNAVNTEMAMCELEKKKIKNVIVYDVSM